MLFAGLKTIFALSAISYTILILAYKKFILKVKDNIKASDYVATIAISLFIYVLFALAFVFVFSDIKFKILMLFFAFMPFIIGKFATYKKYKLFNLAQIFIMLISAVVVCIK